MARVPYDFAIAKERQGAVSQNKDEYKGLKEPARESAQARALTATVGLSLSTPGSKLPPAPAKEASHSRDFQMGRCTQSPDCIYSHSCETCLKKGHGSQDCRSQSSPEGLGKGQNKGNKGKKP